MDSFAQDVRFAVRQLVKSKGFAIFAVVCLALGIGVNTATYSIADGVLFRPFPIPESERVVGVDMTHPKQGYFDGSLSLPDYLEWSPQASTLRESAAYFERSVTITGGDEPERLEGVTGTWNLLPMLGIQPQIGRSFTREDDGTGAAPTVIISDRLWRRRYAGDSRVLGRAILVNGTPRTVVGVMPRGFGFPYRHDLWMPLDLDPAKELRTDRYFTMLGRHAPDTKITIDKQKNEAQIYVPYPMLPWRPMYVLARVRGDPNALARAARAAIWSVDRDVPAFEVKSLDAVRERAVWPFRLFGAMFGGFALLALLLAAAGVYGVMAYSVVQRTHELGVRVALGARTRDVLRLVIAHGAMLAALGIALGLAGALAVSRVLASLLYSVSTSDPLVFLSVASLLAGVALLACLIPARRAASVDPMVALREK